MENWRILNGLWILSAHFVTMSEAHALMIPLRTDWIANDTHRATPAYVWQNDPEVLKLYKVESTTNLCIPAALGTAFLNQYGYEAPASKKLKIAGISAVDNKNIVDTSLLLADLTTRCKGDALNGTTIDDSVRCSAEFYKDAGYSQAKVKMIRPYETSLAIGGAEHENRLATREDIVTALSSGYQIVASIAMIRWDETKKEWLKVASHAVNIVGISKVEGRPDRLFVSNPTRAYRVDGQNPVFDEATLEPVSTLVAESLPKKYSPLVITGRLLTRPNSLTVLAGLLLLRTQ